MVRPHYIAQRVGDEYVLMRVDPVGHVGRVLAGGIGLSLLSRGIRRGGLFSMITCVAGAAFMYHAVTGRDPMDLVCNKNKNTAKHGDDKDSPSFPGEAVSQQLPSDALEEASMESFPASDPPASMHSSARKGG